MEKFPSGTDYVRRTAEMIKTQYPGSWTAMQGKLRQLYKTEQQREYKNKNG